MSNKKERVVVFGGSGFLGGHVADCLSSHGYDVVIADVSPYPYIRKDQSFVQCNIMDLNQVIEITRGANYVYNFAAVAEIEATIKNPVRTVEVNVLGNTHILEACRVNGVKRFLFASSIYVYSTLGSFYRSSKQACEKIIENYHEQFGLDYTVLRYGSLYGPRANDFNSLYKYVKQALREGTISREGDGEEIREYIHVLDAAEGSVQVLDDEYCNQCIMITGMQTMKVKEVLEMIKEIMGKNVQINYLPEVKTSHYKATPYSFKIDCARRLVMKNYYDMGQGLLDLMYEVQSNPDVRSSDEFILSEEISK